MLIYTSGTTGRRVTRAAYLGQDPGDLSALENPEAIKAIERCRSLSRPPAREENGVSS